MKNPSKKTLYLILFLFIVFISGIVLFFIAPKLISYKQKHAPYKQEYAERPNKIFVNFENFELSKAITDRWAYSGQKSAVVEGNNSFSPIIKRPVSEIGLTYMDRAGLSAYIYVFGNNIESLDASLVLAVTDTNENNIFWGNIAIDAVFFPTEKWTKVSGVFDWQDIDIKEEYNINIYLWNNSPTKILLDNVLAVFGKDAPLLGDTTYCHVGAKGKALPPFNYPPHNFLHLPKAHVNTGHLYKLLDVWKKHQGCLSDIILTGNFFNTSDGLDDIIFLDDGQLKWLYYKPQKKEFFSVNLQAPEKISEIWQQSLKLSFSQPHTKDNAFLLIDTLSSKYFLCHLTQETNNESSRPKIIAESLNHNDFYLNNKKPVSFHKVRMPSQKGDKLLCVYENGRMATFSPGTQKWVKTPLVIGGQTQKQITAQRHNMQIVSGFFIKGETMPQLLMIFDDKEKPYKVLTLSQNRLNAVNNQSKVIGYDTLSPTDVYKVIALKGSQDLLLRFADAYRFDMKLLQISDTAYTILNKLDFSGYKKDLNPKFYERPAFITGRFLEADKVSMIAVCTNYGQRKTHNETMQDAIYVFNFK